MPAHESYLVAAFAPAFGELGNRELRRAAEEIAVAAVRIHLGIGENLTEAHEERGSPGLLDVDEEEASVARSIPRRTGRVSCVICHTSRIIHGVSEESAVRIADTP